MAIRLIQKIDSISPLAHQVLLQAGADEVGQERQHCRLPQHRVCDVVAHAIDVEEVHVLSCDAAAEELLSWQPLVIRP